MLFLYLACILLFFIPFPKLVSKGDREWDQYLIKDAALPVKGLFVILVFFRHFISYVTLSDSIFDKVFYRMDRLTGQLIVTMFLFYSGYGIYESIKKKGRPYVSGFIRHRFLPVWLKFAICVFIYFIIGRIVGVKYPIKRILLAFTGICDIGNSNWFIFITLILYLLVFVCFIGPSGREDRGGKWALIIFTLGSLLVAVALFFTKPAYFYNTLFCFALGMWYGYYKNKLDEVLREKYWVILLLAAALVVISRVFARMADPFYCIHSAAFCFFAVLVSVKLRSKSRVLSFLGNHVFSIYILQRLPMNVLKGRIDNIILYFVICFAITLIMALAFDFLESKARKIMAGGK